MLIIIYILIMFGLSTYLWSLLALGSAWFWLLYLLLGFISGILAVIPLALISLLLFRVLKYDNKFKHWIAYQFLDFIVCYMFHIKIDVEGKENIPNETFVVFANHKSMLDILIIYVVYKRVMSAIAKSDLYKIPALHQIMDWFKVIPLDREDDRQGVRDLLRAIKLVAGGYNFIIFPEGGIKTREYETMVGYKAGAFKLATKPGATISPASIIGSSKLSNYCPLFHKTKVKVVIHKPISKSEYQDMNTFEIGEKVKEIIDNGVINNSK